MRCSTASFCTRSVILLGDVANWSSLCKDRRWNSDNYGLIRQITYFRHLYPLLAACVSSLATKHGQCKHQEQVLLVAYPVGAR